MMKKCVCGHEMTAHAWKNQWVCHRCGRTRVLKESVSNADKIREVCAMNDTELVEFLLQFEGIDEMLGFCQCLSACTEITDQGGTVPKENCRQCLLAWLQLSVEEE